MARIFDEKHSIRQYLLRQLSEDQQRSIEKRLLVEDDLFEELEIMEEEILDDYAAGRLTEPERKQFDEYFITTPERQKALEFARALRLHVDSQPLQSQQAVSLSWWQRWESQGWGLRFAAAGLAIAVIAVALWFVVPSPTSTNAPTTIMLAMVSGTRAQGITIQKFPLPPGPLKAVLRLPDSEALAAHYRVRFIDEKGKTTTLEPAERDAQTISVVIPADQLKRGSFALQLVKLEAGTEYPINGSYLFALE